MRGTYRFYQDGVLVGETENLITTAGKSRIIKYLSGYVGSIAGVIAVGTGAITATVGDTSLAFEWYRTPIVLTSADYINSAVVFMGQIPALACGSIYEMGLWSAMDQGQKCRTRLLYTFDSLSESWTLTQAEWNTANGRIGIDALRLAPATSATSLSSVSGIFQDFSGYSDLDEFRLAYNVNTAFVATAKLILYTDISNYYTYTITTPTAGYKITSFHKADFVATGTPAWNNITSAAVQVTSTGGGSGSIDFDGLRIEDKGFNSEEYSLVSRAVPSSPIVKLAGMPLNFEYVLDVSM